MNILFIGDIVGRPGRELMRKGLRTLVEHHGVDLDDRQRRELRRWLRHHEGHRRRAARLGRGRDDVGQSHLGQEGGARRTSRASRVCCVRRTTPPACRDAAHTWRRPATGARRRDQRHGPRVHGAASTIRSPSSSARSMRSATRRASSSWTSMPKRRARRSPWAGISMARSRSSSARTRTCRPPTSASCPTAPRT